MEEEFSPIIEKRKKKSQKIQQGTQQETVALSEVSTESAEQVQASDVNLGVNDAGQQKMKKDLEKPKQKFGLKPLTFFSGLFDLAVGAVLGVLCGLWEYLQCHLFLHFSFLALAWQLCLLFWRFFP